jgi:hypothetical protein
MGDADVLVPLIFILIGVGGYAFLCWGVGAFAKEKGRAKRDWIILAVFLSPFVAFLILLIAGAKTVPEASSCKLVPCPFCAEMIQPAAIKCRFCRESVKPQQSAEIKMISCSGCWHSMPADSESCPYCGKPLISTTKALNI